MFRRIFAVSGLLIKEIFRKKDFYVALILSVIVLFYASQMQFYKVQKIHRYLMEIGLSLSFILSVILGVCLAARQYPSEIETRTCHVLMSKPIRRFEYVFGKYLGSFFAATVCFSVFFGVFILFAILKSSTISPAVCLQTFYLFVLCLALIVAIASGFSYYLSTAANVMITLLLYMIVSIYGPRLRETSQDFAWISRILCDILYYVAPHFEFFDMRARLVHDWPPLDASLVFFLTAYAFLYSAFFLILGWARFRNKVI